MKRYPIRPAAAMLSLIAMSWPGCAPEAPEPTTGVAPGLDADGTPQNPAKLRKSDLPPPGAPGPSPEAPAREPGA